MVTAHICMRPRPFTWHAQQPPHAAAGLDGPALQLHLGVDTKGDHIKLGERWLRFSLLANGKQADGTRCQKPCCCVPCIAAGNDCQDAQPSVLSR